MRIQVRPASRVTHVPSPGPVLPRMSVSPPPAHTVSGPPTDKLRHASPPAQHRARRPPHGPGVSWRRWALVLLSFAATIGIAAYILWSGWAKSGAPPALPLAAHGLALMAVLLEIG